MKKRSWKNSARKEFSLREEYKECYNFLKESKKYIYFILVVFFGFALIGFFLNGVIDSLYTFIFNESLSESILSYIQQLVLQTQGMGIREIIGYLFLNNSQSSLMGIVFGALYGVVPLIATVFNGYLLGFVANLTVSEEGIFVLWRILPHGIFELPAVFLALAMGIRLGDYLLRESRNWVKSFVYIVFGLAISSIGFGIIVGIFNLVSLLVGGQVAFSMDPVQSSGSVLLFLIFATLFVLALILGSFILEKKDRKEVKKIITNSLKVFLLVVFPLLIIAAIIEGTLIILSGG